MNLRSPDKPWAALDGPSPTALSVLGPQSIILGPSPTILSVLSDAGLEDDLFTNSISTSHKSSLDSIYDSPDHADLFADSLPEGAFDGFPDSITLVDDGTTTSLHGTPVYQSADQPYEDNLCVELDLAPAIPESIIDRMSVRPPVNALGAAVDMPLPVSFEAEAPVPIPMVPPAALAVFVQQQERPTGRSRSSTLDNPISPATRGRLMTLDTNNGPNVSSPLSPKSSGVSPLSPGALRRSTKRGSQIFLNRPRHGTIRCNDAEQDRKRSRSRSQPPLPTFHPDCRNQLQPSLSSTAERWSSAPNSPRLAAGSPLHSDSPTNHFVDIATQQTNIPSNHPAAGGQPFPNSLPVSGQASQQTALFHSLLIRSLVPAQHHSTFKILQSVPPVLNGKAAHAYSENDVEWVQLMVGNCLTSFASKETTVSALAQVYDVQPRVTEVVWAQLETNNPEFFVRFNAVQQLQTQVLQMQQDALLFVREHSAAMPVAAGAPSAFVSPSAIQAAAVAAAATGPGSGSWIAPTTNPSNAKPKGRQLSRSKGSAGSRRRAVKSGGNITLSQSSDKAKTRSGGMRKSLPVKSMSGITHGSGGGSGIVSGGMISSGGRGLSSSSGNNSRPLSPSWNASLPEQFDSSGAVFAMPSLRSALSPTGYPITSPPNALGALSPNALCPISPTQGPLSPLQGPLSPVLTTLSPLLDPISPPTTRGQGRPQSVPADLMHQVDKNSPPRGNSNFQAKGGAGLTAAGSEEDVHGSPFTANNVSFQQACAAAAQQVLNKGTGGPVQARVANVHVQWKLQKSSSTPNFDNSYEASPTPSPPPGMVTPPQQAAPTNTVPANTMAMSNHRKSVKPSFREFKFTMETGQKKRFSTTAAGSHRGSPQSSEQNAKSATRSQSCRDLNNSPLSC
eukprot:TRINITY_DN5356_c0_g1_i1.p1 TRINITY_DN5356_c0_g1~~TRINITY_DN5356_c0_g1_i1.p1  ORF type:complete len:901 (-),score=134.64 TRINITY_DN5356_c0_g1_i1:218-2920(-)